MPAVAAPLLDADIAGRQIQLIMHDEDLVRQDLVEPGQSDDGQARAVHEGCRLEQPEIARSSDLSVELALRGKRDFEFPRQRIDKPVADVVAVVFITGTGIAEADQQAKWRHEDTRKAETGFIFHSRKSRRRVSPEAAGQQKKRIRHPPLVQPARQPPLRLPRLRQQPASA